MFFKRVDTVFVPVKNAETSQAWYSDILGLTVGSRSGDGKYIGFRLPSDEGFKTGLTLVQTATWRKAERSYFNFFVSINDVELVRQQLSERGVNVTSIQSRGAMRIFSMEDPDGNKIGVCSWEGGE